MKSLLALSTACLLVAFARPSAMAAQTDVFDFGIHMVRATDIFDGATGVGGQIAVNLPALPVTFRGAVDRFFPDCPEGSSGEATDCGAWGFTVDANLALPMPILHPYLSGGLVRRSVDLGDPLAEIDEVRTGVALGGGLELDVLGVGAFGEARYELRNGPDDEFVFRLGVVF
ncbi:MAG TPA: hypothetical protein VE173_14870 [Longimicrobiales bacterium]|nr:hypothetical protein [Longimicrobiales bacterium]